MTTNSTSAVEALRDVTASLTAALSLLDRAPATIAPSKKMFDHMKRDYQKSVDRARQTLAALERAPAGGPDWTDNDRQLVEQARQHVANAWTKQGWCAEASLHGGYEVWTLDSTGKRRIILARGLTPNTAALMCFVSTALPQLCDLAERLALLPQAQAARGEDVKEGWRPTHQHVKRGTSYQVIGSASLQTGEAVGEAAILVIYRDAKGRLWARPEVEFDDGRFEKLSDVAAHETARLPNPSAELIAELCEVLERIRRYANDGIIVKWAYQALSKAQGLRPLEPPHG